MAKTPSCTQESTPSVLEPAGPALPTDITATVKAAATTTTTMTSSSSTSKRRIELRARTLTVTLPSGTPSTPSLARTNDQPGVMVKKKPRRSKAPKTDDGASAAEVTTINPYINFVAKRIRSLKKRLTRIEANEELLKSDPELKNRMMPEQLESVDRKLDATAPLREFEDMLKLMVDQDNKDKTAEATRLKETEQEETHRVQEQRQTSVASFIQLIRLFYALKELESAEDQLDVNLLKSLRILDMLRSQLFEAAETAELTQDGNQQQRLYDLVMNMTDRSSKAVSDESSVTFSDVLGELDSVTHPSKPRARALDGEDDNTDSQTKITSLELNPQMTRRTKEAVESWLNLNDGQQESIVPPTEISTQEAQISTAGDDQKALQETFHDQTRVRSTVAKKIGEKIQDDTDLSVPERSAYESLGPVCVPTTSSNRAAHATHATVLSAEGAPLRSRYFSQPSELQETRLQDMNQSSPPRSPIMSNKSWLSGGPGDSRSRAPNTVMRHPTECRTRSGRDNQSHYRPREDTIRLKWIGSLPRGEKPATETEEDKASNPVAPYLPEAQDLAHQHLPAMPADELAETRDMSVQTDDFEETLVGVSVVAESRLTAVSNGANITVARRTGRQKRRQGRGQGRNVRVMDHQARIDGPIPIEQPYKMQSEIRLHQQQEQQQQFDERLQGLPPSGLWYPPQPYLHVQSGQAYLYSPVYQEAVQTMEESNLLELETNNENKQQMVGLQHQQDQHGPYNLQRDSSQGPYDAHGPHRSPSRQSHRTVEYRPRYQHHNLFFEQNEEGMPEHPPLIRPHPRSVTPHLGHLAHMHPYTHQQLYQQHPFYYQPGGYYPGLESSMEGSEGAIVSVHREVGVSVEHGAMSGGGGAVIADPSSFEGEDGNEGPEAAVSTTSPTNISEDKGSGGQGGLPASKPTTTL